MRKGSIYFHESLSMALTSLHSNKLRTFLTLLGVIIGVLTIISVVSVIQGLNNYVYTKMSFYGANDFAVSKFSPVITSIKDYQEQLKRKDLTLDDLATLRKLCPSCQLVGASVNASQLVKYGSKSIKNVEVRGVTYVDHLIGSVLELERGRYLMPDDEERSRFVCIIGADVAENLFPGLDPLGRWIKVGQQNFEVIGVGQKKGKILGFSQDNYVWIPISTFMKIYGSRRTITINVHTSSQEEMNQAMEEVRTVLRSLRKRTFNQPDDFAFQTSETFIQLYRSATSGVYFAMIAISSIALLVGGIVIMNIMLVSVTERTKEIGIRMAVGARRRDILMQFLIEAAILSGLGGLIGIILGYIIARVVTLTTSIPSRIDPVSVIVAILMSAVVGLFFGLYPANRAAKLNPVEALRSEQ
ncbi:MAG TPA: ABC transporter permease [Candidatus Saccharicenans sp.]|jgi:putative ABC transport system permease protein|nr:ABC transporter permease [Candidatus Saccharicenans sp.]HQO76143.1 ABC transporter permease [Candidatus Saccharicenans sp.]HUM78951.1 ABC transporter permease [Candidatus Saccharicenans sp.]